MFHLSYYGWVMSKSLKGNLQMCWEPWLHLGSGNNTSGFQYFPLLVWKNDSAFEKYRIYFYLRNISFSAMTLFFFFAVYLVDIRREDSPHSPQFLCLVHLQCVWMGFWAVNWVQVISSYTETGSQWRRESNRAWSRRWDRIWVLPEHEGDGVSDMSCPCVSPKRQVQISGFSYPFHSSAASTKKMLWANVELFLPGSCSGALK